MVGSEVTKQVQGAFMNLNEKFCSYCGQKLNNEALFCFKCGKKVSDE